MSLRYICVMCVLFGQKMRRLFILISMIMCFTYASAIGEWTVYPTSTVYRRGEIFAGSIFLLSGNTIFSVDEAEYTNVKLYNKLTGLNGTAIFDIIVSDKAECLVVVYSDGNIDIIDNAGNITNLPDFANKTIMGDRSLKGVSERDGMVFISTGFGFLILDVAKAEFTETHYEDISTYKDGTYGKRVSTVSDEKLAELNRLVKVNGAGSSSNAALAYNNGMLITANVESDFRSSLYALPGIFSIYDTYDDRWTNTEAPGGLTALAIDPLDNRHYFVGSFSRGLMEYEGENLINHYENMGGSDDVEWIIPDTHTSRVGGIVCDANGYTWFTNVGTDRPLRCITPSGNFLKFPLKGYQKISNGFDKLMIAQNDKYHFKWILGIRPWQQCQIAMYYDGGTPEDMGDDDCVSFSSLIDQDGHRYTPNYFTDIAEDKDGKVWLLTSSGPFVIDSPIETFKSLGKVRRVKIPRNDGTNLADYLFAGVDCSCILVDAANRKWIGTRDNGLYLLSADGQKQLEHFTADNSPLLSDNILALAYDDVSGTLYISCEGGMLSYVCDAVKGADDYSNVVCYPNPVRPEHSGGIHITGLKNHTKVRICDINNRVVYSTLSEGGNVAWDLVDGNSRRIPAGVYLVYGFPEDGKEGLVTKFLVVN